jgi:GNAT superfamily N-acetyltransferase
VTLTFRQHDGTDAACRAALDALLFDIFRLDLGPLDALDGRDPSYTSFSYFDEYGRCVANVSTCAMPLVVQERAVEARGFQSVAVRPDLRGRGLFRELMHRALAWCDERVPLLLLTTVIPDLYRTFGFRVVPEHRIVGAAPLPDGSARPARRLDLRGDLELVKRLLDERVPVSDFVGLRHFGAMFLMNVAKSAHMRLDYLEDHDAIVVSDRRQYGPFTLHDVVGRRIPSLAVILGALGLRPDNVDIRLPTDKLAYAGEPALTGKDTVLMARGCFVDGSRPFMLPHTADF